MRKQRTVVTHGLGSKDNLRLFGPPEILAEQTWERSTVHQLAYQLTDYVSQCFGKESNHEPCKPLIDGSELVHPSWRGTIPAVGKSRGPNDCWSAKFCDRCPRSWDLIDGLLDSLPSDQATSRPRYNQTPTSNLTKAGWKMAQMIPTPNWVLPTTEWCSPVC